METLASVQLIKVLLVLTLVALCCVTDLSTRRIPNAVLLPALVTAFFLNGIESGMAGLADSFGGLVVGIGMLMPLYVLGQMGAGDVKLLGVVGSLIGAWAALIAGVATMIAGGILGLAYLAWLVALPQVAVRLRQLSAPVHGSPSNDLNSLPSCQPMRTAGVPYAVAIAAGTVAALLYTGLIRAVVIT